MSSFPLHTLLRHRWLAGVLAIAVLVAQAAGLLHKLDFEAHPAGIACATCLAHGQTDTPVPTVAANPPSLPVAIAPVVASVDAVAERTRQPVRARGPPSLV